jgi:hypothetical protein
LGNSLSIEGGFIFRELHHAWETINLALPASLYTLPVQENVPATWDPQGNITSTRPLTLWDVPKNLITPSLNQISSPSGNNYLYRNLELTINKRLSQHFTAVADVYWTHTTASIQSVSSAGAPTAGVATNPNQLINNSESYSFWTSHVTGTYLAPWGIEISPVLRMQQGAPLLETYAVTGLNIGTQYVPLAPYGAYRDPNLYVFDLRFQKSLKFHERYRVSFYFDLFNLFNSNTANVESPVVAQKSTVVNVVGNQEFGQKVLYQGFLSPTTILPPRIFRIGARFSF